MEQTAQTAQTAQSEQSVAKAVLVDELYKSIQEGRKISQDFGTWN